ncbi:oligosaccharyl transferase stt3 subunit [Maudiozyma exigua]|uniref:Dolichyl-diphosphooligosaccharide--protein glycosyltransferase subunit STT3 n=1 Tax=Maudiozyma exigua TaxID=34358 RepID=A0A9P6WFQ7_MAUEX|nr:oligosaccharyl transferase stt3 subunit [Kazachstania exigua]
MSEIAEKIVVPDTAVTANENDTTTQKDGNCVSWIQSSLKTLIFIAIIIASISSRLFAVIRFESIIHEFDPWFNYRATQYLVNNSFKDFLNWFDERTWYPLGRVTGGTLYPGLMTTSAFIWHALRKIGLPVDIRNICVLFAPAFSAITAYVTYKLTCELKDEKAGLLAAAFIGIVPGYISRSVAGSYDNEAIAITLLMATFMFWIKGLKQGSILNSSFAALCYFYMVSAWGGYVFITNLIPFHVFCLILMGRYTSKIYVAYNTWFVIGTIASMQIPFVGFLPIKSNDHMAALGVFCLLQIVALGDFIKAKISEKKFKVIMWVSIILIMIGGIAGLFLLTYLGLIAPWTGRFYSLWDTNYARIHIPIIASVSEHQPITWPAFFLDTHFLIWLFPAAVFLMFMDLKNEHVFIIVYSVLCSYFAGVMVRLMLTLTPVICIAGAVALSKLFDIYLDFSPIFSTKKTGTTKSSVMTVLTRALVSASFIYYLYLFVHHCTWVTQSAYSSPSVVLPSQNRDGSMAIIDDYREAYYWLRMNTDYDAKIASWWDYGYQIGGMADRTTLVDNNTWNNTHIAIVGKAMASPEEVSYELLKEHDVDYVLVIFGGVLGFGGDDINKFLWMIRIAEGIWPEEVKERDFFVNQGEFRVDSQASQTMKKSLMYKMSYHGFPDLFPNGQGQDRVRQQVVTAADVEDLDYFDEVFSSENWLVRIYKLKDLDIEGRDLSDFAEFEKSKNTKRSSNKRPEIDLRV